jgi:beta-N-acetylhexosaminidase
MMKRAWKITLLLPVCLLVLAAPGGLAASAGVEAMIGQMLMTGFRGDGESEAGDLPRIRRLARQGKIGGVILFNVDLERPGQLRNISGPAQLRGLSALLQAEAPIPLFIAVDQEGGKVQRLRPGQGFRAWPSARVLGGLSDARVEELARALGRELAGVGINLNFAPALDVDVNPASPAIGALERSFSANPSIVASKGLAFVRGLNQAGLAGCLKHFPGHGSAGTDSHLGFTDVSASWSEAELLPYREIFRQGGRYGVMIAHVFLRRLDASRPASLSGPVIDGLLRRDLGWRGVVFSDDLQMRAISDHYSLEETLLLGLRAGLDVFVFGNNQRYEPDLAEKAHALLLRLYREGKVGRERLEASYGRILRLKGVQP